MKSLLRPRLWIALLLGVAAGLMVSLLPPRPYATLTMELPQVEDEYPFVQVLGLSGDGRYLIVRQGVSMLPASRLSQFAEESIALWDRERAEAGPVVSFKSRSITMLLSPDASVLCVVHGPGKEYQELPDGKFGYAPKARPIGLYELPGGRKLREVQSAADAVFFGPDGKLMAVEDRVVSEFESGRVVQRLPAKIDGSAFRQTLGEYAIYATDDPQAKMRIHSCLTGELRSTTTLPFYEYVTQVCADGRVLCWTPRDWLNIGMRDKYPSKILDAASGHEENYTLGAGLRSMQYGDFATASPDGEVFVYSATTPPPPKWLAWLPMRKDGARLRVVRWRTNEQLAIFPEAPEACFSGDGTQLAMVRDGGVIELYDFPFRNPWSLMACAFIGVAAGTWVFGCLWSRWRARRKQAAAAVIQASAESGTVK